MKALRFCCLFAEKMTGFSVREFNGREGKELLAKQEKIS
jgi:hypothetical protein